MAYYSRWSDELKLVDLTFEKEKVSKRVRSIALRKSEMEIPWPVNQYWQIDPNKFFYYPFGTDPFVIGFGVVDLKG
jgi:hypothetical protein